MNKVKIVLIIIMGYSLTNAACDLRSVSVAQYQFYIQNNSQDTFEYSYSAKFPDTSVQEIYDSSLIYPNKKQLISIPTFLLPNFGTTGTMELFLINIDTLKKYSWGDVASKYLITKRFNLTFDSIKKWIMW